MAKRFSNGGIILTITLTNTYENYCRFIGDISQYKDEEGRALLKLKEGNTHHGGCGHCGG